MSTLVTLKKKNGEWTRLRQTMMNVITWSCIEGKRLNHTGNSAAETSIILNLVGTALFSRTLGEYKQLKMATNLFHHDF